MFIPANKSTCVIRKSIHSLILTSELSTFSKSNLRLSVSKNIAKNFNKISLKRFPLAKLEDVELSKYKRIERAHNKCQVERLNELPNYFPSITTILNQTMSPESLAILKKWEAEKIKYEFNGLS